MGETGYERLDRMTGKALAAIEGFVVKQKSVTVVRDPGKKRERTKVDEIKVTKFERIAPGSAAGELRPAADCKPVSDDRLEEAAKDLLKSIAKP